jgi:hypothetical protein
MKYQKLLLLLLISFAFGLRSHSFIRKLQIESDMPSSEPEEETTLPFIVPTHTPDTTVPVGPEPSGPGPVGPGGQTTPQPSVPDHNVTETETPQPPTTNPNVRPIPGHENDPITTIPSIITKEPYFDPRNTIPPKLIFAGIGNFGMKPPKNEESEVTFTVYFINLGTGQVVSYHLTIKLKVAVKRSRRPRALQEGEEDIEEIEKDAECYRITSDADSNIKYDCSFGVDENVELDKVTMDPTSPPKFEGMDDAIAPEITISSLVNETLTEKGIQAATGNELLKTQYLMNNTVLEENGLKFKLTGEMDTYLPDKEITLSFDEKGDGKIKNATCDASYLQGNIFEFDCLAEKGINAHLNGVSGVTTNTQEKVIIYMKPGTDEVLNAGSNYMGLYNRGSSSGLSGGAIAGIVIACVIALLAIAIGAMLCRKTNVPAPFQESTLGVNTSNMTD